MSKQTLQNKASVSTAFAYAYAKAIKAKDRTALYECNQLSGSSNETVIDYDKEYLDNTLHYLELKNNRSHRRGSKIK